jgi:hypothetical protein
VSQVTSYSPDCRLILLRRLGLRDRSGQTEVAFMDGKEPTYFDLETVSVLRESLEDAWACLRPEQRATMSRSLLAERILKAATQGERNRERLLDAALDVDP